MVQRSANEESWNAGTHLLGAALALPGLVLMWMQVRSSFPSPAAVACVGYVVLLVLMYLMSSASHWFRSAERMERYRALDQAFIYLLIVGTYSPFSIHFWNSVPANLLLGVMWAIALTGFISKVFFRHRVSHVSVIGYVILGWMPVLGLPFHGQWHAACFYWVLAGGIVYSAGTIFLLNDRRAMWCHPVWHLCVMVASAIHFTAVFKFVALDL